ncbi:hypothetical protein D3C71_1769260 [compost metagenome]
MGVLALVGRNVSTIGKALAGGDGRGCTQCSTRFVPALQKQRRGHGRRACAGDCVGAGNAVLRGRRGRHPRVAWIHWRAGKKNGTAKAVPSGIRCRARA